MDLDELKRKSVIHDKKSADEIRKRYIETFVNTEKSSYHDQIEKLQKFTDGYCYVGYLWDFLREPEMVEESLIYSYRDKMNPFMFSGIFIHRKKYGLRTIGNLIRMLCYGCQWIHYWQMRIFAGGYIHL